MAAILILFRLRRSSFGYFFAYLPSLVFVSVLGIKVIGECCIFDAKRIAHCKSDYQHCLMLDQAHFVLVPASGDLPKSM